MHTHQCGGLVILGALVEILDGEFDNVRTGHGFFSAQR
jgi:hypothetical protein